MSSSAINNIEFNQSVEKLKTNGSNWIIFQWWFMIVIAINNCKFIEHFTRDAAKPVAAFAASLTEAKTKLIKE